MSLALLVAVSSDGNAQQDSASTGEWFVRITPYFWLAGMQGEMGVEGVDPIEFNATWQDFAHHLAGGIAAALEVSKQQWGLLVDGSYVKLTAEADFPTAAYSGVDATAKSGLVNAAICLSEEGRTRRGLHRKGREQGS